MNKKLQKPAIEGWYTLDTEQPRLIGSRCKKCGTYYFPKQSTSCHNPSCDSTEFEEVALSRTGKVWSYTDVHYQPPEPYIAPDPYVPVNLVAVELEQEQMIVMGQMASGFDLDTLKVGDDVELTLEALHEDEEEQKMIWKWKPVALSPSTGEQI